MNSRYAAFLYLIIPIIALSCAPRASRNPLPGEIIVRSVPAINPVLKRLPANPLLRLEIYVPEGRVAEYRSIRCSLNEDAVRSLQKIDVYHTDREPQFSTTNPVASPAIATGMEIPVSLNLHPGWNYIWFSGVLKDDADLDNLIEFHALQLRDANGNVQTVSETGSYSKLSGIALRKAGDDNVHTYRIPGIAATDKGTVIAVYDIRYNNSGDLPGHVDVGINRSTDGGKTWGPMKIIMDMGEPHQNNGIGDPAILFDPVTKTLWVAALWSKGNRSIAGSEPGLSPDTTGQFVLVSSSDDGVTWSAPINITAQVKDPKWHLYFQGPGNGIAMQDGTLVFPSQYWDESRKPGMPHSAIIYSKDHGKTWQSGIGAKRNTTESQVVETTPGTLMLNMRDNRGSFRSVAITKDLGKTWIEHVTSYHALPDPVCMAGLTKSSVNVSGTGREVVFFSNCNSSTARHNLTVKASLDLGESWLPGNEFLVDERRTFGYSAIIKIDDRTLGLIYEGIRDLYFVRIPVNRIVR
jgi:sialidase-1